MAKNALQVFCARKRWKIAIGNHRNVLVSYSRYPLEGSLDLGDFTNADFERLAIFFGQRKADSKCVSSNNKWSFHLNPHYSLIITFQHYPFNGVLDIGDISQETCELLLSMFVQAQQV